MSRRCATCDHEEVDHLADDDWCKELAGSCTYTDAMGGGCACQQFIGHDDAGGGKCSCGVDGCDNADS